MARLCLGLNKVLRITDLFARYRVFSLSAVLRNIIQQQLLIKQVEFKIMYSNQLSSILRRTFYKCLKADEKCRESFTRKLCTTEMF